VHLNVKKSALVLYVIVVALFYVATTVGAAEAKPSQPENTHFAIVDGQTISLQEFQSAYQAGVRKRFYHGKIPPEQLAAFKNEVSQTLIDRVLLIKEAKRLNVKADEKHVKEQIALYEKRYANQEFWKQHKSQVISGLRQALEEESQVKNLEAQIKNTPLPAIKDANAFYDANRALFTTPEKMRVSLILLKVAPSSPGDVWEAAKKEADQIIQRLQKGADFAELARIHSGDNSAAKGGDMGFVHKGMLAKPAQFALDNLKEKEISPAVMLLRGIAIFRLEERAEAELNPFDKVTERAQKLLQRENSKNAWADLLEQLRSKAKIEINTAALKEDKKS